MRAPAPLFIVAIAAVIATWNVMAGGPPSTARELGYLVGSAGIPILLALGYAWWYRRRKRSAG